MGTRPDPRFFENLGPISLGDLAGAAGAVVPASISSQAIEAVAVLARADAGAVTFFSDRRHAKAARLTRAGASFVSEADAGLLPPECATLITPAPQAAWAVAAARLHRPRRIDPDAPAIHPSAELETGVRIGQGAVVGEGAQIGAGTSVGPGAVIGPGVAIGRDCEVGSRAVLGFALIGDRVTILAGAVIGEAGFGVTVGPDGLSDVPQLGRVILQDGVLIGANSCVDRGAFDDTVVGEDSKIDNLVQIAHNVQIGRGCVIAGMTGLSGSVRIGDGAMIGGGVGVADHVEIESGAQVGARSGVGKRIPAGEAWMGYPARPIGLFLREMAWLTRAARRKGASHEET